MRRILILTAVWMLTVGCICTAPLNAPTAQNDRQADEYDVYAALINEMYVRGQVELIVIVDYTATGLGDDLDKTLEYVAESISDVQKETLDDFKIQNDQSYPLSDDFDLDVTHKLISQQEMTEIFSEGDGWDEFYTKHPNSQGTMTLSRVGFNQERDQALVYVGNQGHWLAGAGYYVLLAKENGVWVIQGEVMVWIS